MTGNLRHFFLLEYNLDNDSNSTTSSNSLRAQQRFVELKSRNIFEIYELTLDTHLEEIGLTRTATLMFAMLPSRDNQLASIVMARISLDIGNNREWRKMDDPRVLRVAHIAAYRKARIEKREGSELCAHWPGARVVLLR